ncbi:MAG: hypothetical protein ACP5DZ_02605 [Bacteroidales bacterium]
MLTITEFHTPLITAGCIRNWWMPDTGFSCSAGKKLYNDFHSIV